MAVSFAAAVAHSGRASTLYKSKKLARNCHNNLKKKKREGCEGEESEVQGAEQRNSAGSSLHYRYFVDFNSFNTCT
jgi:hypothetical protein